MSSLWWIWPVFVVLHVLSEYIFACTITFKIPFFVCSRKSPRQSSAVTSRLMTSSSWPAQETRRPLCTKWFTKASTDGIPEQPKCHATRGAEKPRSDFGTVWWTWTWRWRERLRFLSFFLTFFLFSFFLMSVRGRHWGRTAELQKRTDLVVFLMLWES